MAYIRIEKYTVKHPYEWPVISRERYEVLKRYPTPSSFIKYSTFRYLWNYLNCTVVVLIPFVILAIILVVQSGLDKSRAFYSIKDSIVGLLGIFGVLALLVVFNVMFGPDELGNYFRYVRWVHRQRRHAKWIVAAALASESYEEFAEAYDAYRAQFRH